MIDSNLINKLVQLYRVNENAKYFFQELATMKQTKSNIDLERRRRAINVIKGVNVSRQETAEFFAQLQDLGLGKLQLFTNIKDGNSKFHWTLKEYDAIEIATEVIKRAKSGPSLITSDKNPSNMVYLYRTRAGDMVKLSTEDIEDIKQLT